MTASTLAPPRVNRPPTGPTPSQRAAADPSASVWVTASAGTGKTRVLADRVLRLMLAGTKPEGILCLTFTKAAAAEMTTRITRDLGDWATGHDAAKLRAELETLLGRRPTREEEAVARRLFARVLDMPGGLAIVTIHAFGQSLLRRFPLEAGVPPNFELIDERTAVEKLHAARDAVLASADPDTRRHLAELSTHMGDDRLTEALGQLINARQKLARLKGGHERPVDGVVERVYRELGVPAAATDAGLVLAACADAAFDVDGLRDLARVLAETGTAKDGERAERLFGWLASGERERAAGMDDHRDVFLKKTDGAPRALSGVVTKKPLAAFPFAERVVAREQERLVDLASRRSALRVAGRTEALLRIADAVIARFEERKAEANELDYDDLIERTRLLLAPENARAPWVLYKLDHRIDHLLVDEAQDTSPDQWAIIEGLVDEFYAGQGARDVERTLFVVGDEKQSIYSFQGADLAAFRATRESMRAKAEAARRPWREETLDLSFRSTSAVLRAVDAVFAPERAARDGVADPGLPLHHEAFRAGAGLVELWPLAETEDGPPPEADAPDDKPPPRDAPAELARAIAGTIRGWLDRGETLASTGAAIRPGDVLILLPRRGDFQPMLVRELKRKHVAVAGADRMALTAQLAVQDLMALGDALLLPEDDLTLAALLKSPLFGLDEDDLFALAHGRAPGETLFERLTRSNAPVCRDARDRFAAIRARADFVPPFELYAEVLGAWGGRKRLLTQIGPEAVEPIEEFLAQALVFERGHVPTLQEFLRWLRLETSDIKRDPEQPRDEVRVLTVHGAKGLEAPIVFLPETTHVPRHQERLLWRDGEAPPLWNPPGAERAGLVETAYEAERGRRLQEQRRLLYVALTRARDRLYVAGWRRRRGSGSEATWYDFVKEGLASLPDIERVPMAIGPGIEGEGLRLTAGDPSAVLETARPREAPERAAGRPDWWDRPAPPEATAGPTLSPSHFNDDAPAASSPFADGRNGLRRGRLVHRLLQLLPDLPRERRPAALSDCLARRAHELDDAERAAIAGQVLAVLETPEFRPLFAPDARAEVPLVGRIGAAVVSGVVDRLAVTAEAVFVVDYKTDRRPPDDVRDTPVAYLRQLAAYRAVLRSMFTDRPVRCALLWTEDTRLVSLDDALLDAHLPASLAAS